MGISIGNAPCSWGVEFADDTRNPPWKQVLWDCANAGYKGIELGPVGYMPEDKHILSEALAETKLQLIGGVIFQPFHDLSLWDDVLIAARRTCQSLSNHGARHLVIIDSISPRRAPTAGNYEASEKMDNSEWEGFKARIEMIAKIGTEEYGLDVGIHAHCGGFMDYEPELERLLQEIDEKILGICFDTGHHYYAGYDPVAFMQRNMNRIKYIHFKDVDPKVHQRVINNQIGFYDACGQKIFCTLGNGAVNFVEIKKLLDNYGYNGWCTIEQDCDPTLEVSPLEDAIWNRTYLQKIGF